MEEVPQDLGYSSPPAGSRKKKFLVVFLIIFILIIGLVFARAAIKNSIINKGSRSIRESLQKGIYPLAPPINLSEEEILELREEISKKNLLEAEKIIQENRKGLLKQIVELKEKGETEFIIRDQIYHCGEENLTAEEMFLGVRCNSGEVSIEGEGYKTITSGNPKVLKEISLDTLAIFLQEYAYSVLEENKYELTRELENLIAELETLEEIDKDKEIEGEVIKKKIELIKENSGAVMAQGLDFLYFIASFSRESGGLMGALGKVNFTGEEDIGEEISKIESIDASLKFPSEQEIEDLDIIDNCMEAFREADENNPKRQAIQASATERFLLIKATLQDICYNLERYQKENAIRIVKRISDEENPILSILYKTYSSALIKCEEEWFSTGSQCIKDHFEDFETDFLSAMSSS
jgi:hypothetical protein